MKPPALLPRARRPAPAVARISLREADHVSLCETLDRVLNKGAVLAGDLTISVADIDLIWLGLQVMVSSVETMREAGSRPPIVR